MSTTSVRAPTMAAEAYRGISQAELRIKPPHCRTSPEWCWPSRPHLRSALIKGLNGVRWKLQEQRGIILEKSHCTAHSFRDEIIVRVDIDCVRFISLQSCQDHPLHHLRIAGIDPVFFPPATSKLCWISPGMIGAQSAFSSRRACITRSYPFIGVLLLFK